MTIANYDYEIERHNHPENFAVSPTDDESLLDVTLSDPDIDALVEAGYLDENAPYQANIL